VRNVSGVDIANGAKNNRVGTTALADRNVISGNAFTGVFLAAAGTSGNLVQNNIIGLNPAGTARVRNLRIGADINLGAASNVIGGLNPNEGNVLSGNAAAGAEISHPTGTSLNRILGNRIGTDLTGNSAPSYTHNSEQGIHVEDTASSNEIRGNVIGANLFGGISVDGTGTRLNVIADNLIGIGRTGTPMGNKLFGVHVRLHARDMTIMNNTIAFNDVGVDLEAADNDGVKITQNSIYGNVGLGIDLEPLGAVNPNDPGDADTGANEGLNFPVITGATPTSVSGTACAGCTVEVFRADSPAGQNGEGQTYLASATAAANGTFSVTVTGLAAGDVVTSTATDAAGNTSEFGVNVAVTGGPPPPPPPASAADAFGRLVTDGWGSADTGGAWTLGTAAADYDVNGSAGTIVVPVAGASGQRYAFLGAVSLADVDLTASISPDKVTTASSAYVGLNARRQASGQEYRFRLRLGNNGIVYLHAAIAQGTTETFLGGEVNTGITYTAGSVIRLRVQATGANPTTLRMKAWRDGTSEPGGFAYSATDSTAALQGPGAVGVWARISSSATSAPTVFSYDDFVAKAP
jgi:hypothetical protein